MTLGTRKNASFILAHVKAHEYTISMSYPRAEWNRWRGQMAGGIPVEQQKPRVWRENDAPENPPEGWRFLGQGWSRYAFLGPDGVVYKVCRKTDGSGSNRYGESLLMNRSEARRYKEMADKVAIHGYRLAPCRLIYSSVLAMEYIPEPDKKLHYSVMSKITRLTGVSDLHSTNVWADPDGVPTLIDYAS